MKQDHFVTAAGIVIIYVIMKIVEAKFILKEDLVVKKIVIDAISVYVSVIVGIFVLEQVSSGVDTKTTFAFTTNPDF